MQQNPPFNINNHILVLCQKIERTLGLLEGLILSKTPIKLRKENQIKTIYSTLYIEGNTLELNQVRSIIDGKIVLAPKKDIIEVKNAIDLYGRIAQLNPMAIQDLKKAHKILMTDLIDTCGKFRTKGVGIFQGKKIVHVAPPASRVNGLISNLFKFVKNGKFSWLIKACVFHYELEFIHPFTDGNGRIGRLWQQLILMQEDKIFQYIPVEEMIKNNQKEYYNVLAKCDQAGDSTEFISYSLQQILISLEKYLSKLPNNANALGVKDRLEFFRDNLTKEWFTRNDYLELHKNISTSTASRDLSYAIELGLLEKTGVKNTTKYKFSAN